MAVQLAEALEDFEGPAVPPVQAVQTARLGGRWVPQPLGMLTDPRLSNLWNGAAVGLYAHLCSATQQGAVRGLLQFQGTSVAACLAAAVPLSCDQIDACLDALAQAGVVLIDRGHRLVYVPAMQAAICAAPTSIKAVAAIATQIQRLPSCTLVDRAQQDLLTVTEQAEQIRAHRRQVQPDETLYSRVQRALGLRLVSVPPQPEPPGGQLSLPLVMTATLSVVPPMSDEITPFIDFAALYEPQPHQGATTPAVRRETSPLAPSPTLIQERRDDPAATAPTGRVLGAHPPRPAQPLCIVAPADRAAAGAGDASDRRSGPVQPRWPAAAPVRCTVPGEFSTAGAPFAALWRKLAALCPALDGGDPEATPTGLSHRDQATVARAWLNLAAAGRTNADLLLVGDWINAGGLSWTHRGGGGGPLGFVVGNLGRCVADARKWKDDAQPVGSPMGGAGSYFMRRAAELHRNEKADAGT